MILFGALSVFVGWITAVALVVVVRTLIEYPLLEISTLEAGAPVSPFLLRVRLAYAALAAGVGGFVTAWLAPRAPLRHAWALAALVAAPAMAYALPERPGEFPGHDPAAVVLPVVSVLVGAWLRARLEDGRPSPASGADPDD